jgi:hypothetical protein
VKNWCTEENFSKGDKLSVEIVEVSRVLVNRVLDSGVSVKER